MVTNKIRIGRGSKVMFPLFHEIREGKVRMSLQVYEGDEVKLRVSDKNLREWLGANADSFAGSQQYPLEQPQYTLFFRKEQIYFACNEDLQAELEWLIEWGDSTIRAIGKFAGEFSVREAVSAEKVPEKSEKEEQLEQELLAEQGKNGIYQEIIQGYMLQSFHESGTYVRKLNEIEESLKGSEAQKVFQEWKERQKALEEKKAELEKALEKLVEECTTKEQEYEEQKKQYEEKQKRLEELDKLNEETLKKLQENRERLKMDQEVLQFIENNNLDVEKELKAVEETLKKTEKMVREAIVLKENKIDFIEKAVRGDDGGGQ